jgi:hypothetical protein
MTIDVFPQTNQLGQEIGVDIYRDDQKLRDFASLYNFIHWLFRYRCVGLDGPCNKQARDVSHIRTGHDDSNWREIVLHCVECHREYHDRGVSDEAIEKLIERRRDYLEVIGRGEYV